jgi:hypothetical protein
MSNWLKITPDSDFSFFLALLEVFLSILSSCGFLSSSFLIRFTEKIESIFYTPENSSIQKIDQAIVHALDSLTHCERNSNMTNSRKCLSSGFTSGFCVKILTLIYMFRNWPHRILFRERIFTNISTDIHWLFPDILVTITSLNICLNQHLVVRRRRSAPSLNTSRFHI